MIQKSISPVAQKLILWIQISCSVANTINNFLHESKELCSLVAGRKNRLMHMVEETINISKPLLRLDYKRRGLPYQSSLQLVSKCQTKEVQLIKFDGLQPPHRHKHQELQKQWSIFIEKIAYIWKHLVPLQTEIANASAGKGIFTSSFKHVQQTVKKNHYGYIGSS